MKSLSKIRYLNGLLKAKEISCVELTKRYLDEIEKVNSKLNAYVRITPDEALLTAKKVDVKIKRGEELMPLEGIPMTLKDNISTKDIETTCCSKALTGYVPFFDATVWELLHSQNAVLLGKTNMDEFAMGSTCKTSYFGGALNPLDTTRVSGGSSGGVASAVGGNIAVYGLGSDTGGSIRQPASFCGLVGLKPTYGSVSRYGIVACASSLDQAGPITSCVEDAAIVYDAIAVYDKKDATSQGKRCKAAPNLENSIKGMKIGLLKELSDSANEEVRECVRKAAALFSKLGAEIVDIEIPVLEYTLPVYFTLAYAEFSSNMGRYDGIGYGYRTPYYNDVNDMICKTRTEGFGREVKKRILFGTYVLTKGCYDIYFKKAWKLRGAIVKSFKAVFSDCDLLLTPTVPTTAFKFNNDASENKDEYISNICTAPANLAGLPAVTVPCGFDSRGLPVGMQIIGDKFNDARVLNAAYQFEKQTCDKIYKKTETGVIL
ncbi:MAG TPA: Asp-tRNA(Asn)/Glu-tRNA(Gln) amidotransferase subunit GatA [Clostridiaceae bacterium]|jgi:aspartyl-tRNA(Asn)/glutamyl-tRNA(Gln) amidotransferase subunit A|nr:Asp-tRNA(Asn)/Glu-tRNA(Gln) amidotransferase subunit GatA [Clostridiaceae bacterium]